MCRPIYLYMCCWPGCNMFGSCAMRLTGPGCSWRAVVVSAAMVFLVAALGLASGSHSHP